jgi:hypothetical protein
MSTTDEAVIPVDAGGGATVIIPRRKLRMAAAMTGLGDTTAWRCAADHQHEARNDARARLAAALEELGECAAAAAIRSGASRAVLRDVGRRIMTLRDDGQGSGGRRG